MRTRETFIVALRAEAADASGTWLDLYEREPSRLDQALARAGLLTVADITRSQCRS